MKEGDRLIIASVLMEQSERTYEMCMVCPKGFGKSCVGEIAKFVRKGNSSTYLICKFKNERQCAVKYSEIVNLDKFPLEI
jgi:hypothetical protein